MALSAGASSVVRGTAWWTRQPPIRRQPIERRGCAVFAVQEFGIRPLSRSNAESAMVPNHVHTSTLVDKLSYGRDALS
jgi:hypothetical protein